MQIVSNIALISINETVIIQLISFLIFLFIINRIMFRPLQSVMGEREGYIDQVKQDIVDAENSLDNFMSQLGEKESSARSEASELRRQLEGMGSHQAAEIFASVREEIDALKQNAQRDVQAQLAEARKHLKKESETLATSIMEKLLDRRLSQ